MICGKTGKQIRDRDLRRQNKLEEKFPLKIVWECEVKEELKTNQEMAEFFESYEALVSLHSFSLVSRKILGSSSMRESTCGWQNRSFPTLSE